MTRLNANQREDLKNLMNKLFMQVEKAEFSGNQIRIAEYNSNLDLMDEVLTILDAKIVWDNETSVCIDRVKEIR